MTDADRDEPETQAPPPRPQIETLIGRALKLRCPRCGEGKLFEGFVRMPRRCARCGLIFHRAPGYYLGSAYINYGLTAGLVTASFLFGRLILHIPGRQMLWPLFAFCVVFPLLIFRHSRALWLAMDCQFDKTVLEDEWASSSGDGKPF
jgi:uncharacterized protein (DUF983 family)